MTKFRTKPDRRRPGRPTVAPAKKRTEGVLVHLTPEEKATVDRECYEAGFSASYVMRTRYFSSSSSR
jgi:hypothetical protein